MPTIGRSGTLRQTLASVKRQSHDHLEILVLDNASGLEAQHVIQEFMESDPRARLLRSNHRLPMFHNFARGVVAAGGTYLTFFHDDDVYLPGFIERQVQLLEADAGIAFTGSNWEVIDESGELLRRRALIHKTSVWSGHRYILTLLRTGVNIIPMPGVVFRRSLLEPEAFVRYGQPGFTDFVLLMRIAEDHRVGLIKDCLMHIRSHPDQASRTLSADLAATLLVSTFDDYCTDFSVRRPLQRTFANVMRRKATQGRRQALLWAWLTADDDRDARRYARTFGGGLLDRLIGHALLDLERTGLASLSSRTAMTSAVRWVSNSVLSRALLIDRLSLQTEAR